MGSNYSLLLTVYNRLIWSRCYCPSFKDEETEAPRRELPWVTNVEELTFGFRSVLTLNLCLFFFSSTSCFVDWFHIKCLFLASRSEKAMTTHPSTLAWKIPWTEEPCRLQSMRSLGVGHDWATSLSIFTFMHWRRKWQPTPVGWRIPWTVEPGDRLSMGSHRVERDWTVLAAAAAAAAASQ